MSEQVLIPSFYKVMREEKEDAQNLWDTHVATEWTISSANIGRKLRQDEDQASKQVPYRVLRNLDLCLQPELVVLLVLATDFCMDDFFIPPVLIMLFSAFCELLWL